MEDVRPYMVEDEEEQDEAPPELELVALDDEVPFHIPRD